MFLSFVLFVFLPGLSPSFFSSFLSKSQGTMTEALGPKPPVKSAADQTGTSRITRVVLFVCSLLYFCFCLLIRLGFSVCLFAFAFFVRLFVFDLFYLYFVWFFYCDDEPSDNVCMSPNKAYDTCLVVLKKHDLLLEIRVYVNLQGFF